MKEGTVNLLCIPIIAQDIEGAIAKISEAEKHADILELRLDLMSSFHLEQLIDAANKPVIVTYRSEKEGGQGNLDPSIVADHLMTAVQKKAEYIDIELNMPTELRDKIIQNKGASRIIISTHIMDGTPSDDKLNILLENSIRANADIVKIVTMANRPYDNLRMLDLVSKAHTRGIKIIAFCMGSLGRMSRIFSLLMGGYLTFASLKGGEESAPGQIPVNEMKKLLEYFAV